MSKTTLFHLARTTMSRQGATGSLSDAPVDLEATRITATTATLNWAGSQDNYNVRYRKAVDVDPSTPATIILEAGDVWGDGSGYQMLLDADATAYGTLWNANHYIFVDGVQYTGGDLPTTYYNEFEYKIPGGADGALSTTNVVVDGSVTITIPAGTYDYVIFNPTPGDKFYIASDNGDVGGAEDNFVFEPGVTYHFTIQKYSEYIDDWDTYFDRDGAALEITRPMGDWTTVENVTSPYTLSGLTPETYYEWQAQGVLADGGTTEWAGGSSVTTCKVLPGDANGDGVVGIADMAWIVHYLLGNTNIGIDTVNADVDNNGVDIGDVNAIVNLILNGSTTTP